MGVLFDGHKNEDGVQDRHRLLKTTNHLSAYIVDFRSDESMKETELPYNYAVYWILPPATQYTRIYYVCVI